MIVARADLSSAGVRDPGTRRGYPGRRGWS